MILFLVLDINSENLSVFWRFVNMYDDKTLKWLLFCIIHVVKQKHKWKHMVVNRYRNMWYVCQWASFKQPNQIWFPCLNKWQKHGEPKYRYIGEDDSNSIHINISMSYTRNSVRGPAPFAWIKKNNTQHKRTQKKNLALYKWN